MDNEGTAKAMYTVNDLARILNCGKTKAWEIVNSEQIRTVRVGRLVRISPEDLSEFIRKHRS